MNVKVIIYSIFLLLGVLASCRKELPKFPNTEVPVFFFQFDGAGLNVNLQAGVNTAQYSDEVLVENLVKIYTGTVYKADTSITFKFYAGEVFRNMTLQEFMAITNTLQVSLASDSILAFDMVALNQSQFDNANFSSNGVNVQQELNFSTPGKYQIGIAAFRNGFDVELNNTTVIGYDNPYLFELQGNVNSSGPGIILEGSILNNSENIERIDWICGTNTQTTSTPSIQFPPAGSGNILTAIVYFSDGTTRTRSIALGFQNAPKIEDYVYAMEQSSNTSFSKKFVLEFNFNGQFYTSLFATDFTAGQPFLNIEDKTVYTDPVTSEKSYLIKANGLVYMKNMTTNETFPLNLNMSFGLPIEF